MKLLQLSLSCLAILFSGCVSSDIDEMTYQRSPIQRNPHVEIEDVSRQKRVIVLPFDNSSIDAASKAQVGEVMAKELEFQLMKYGQVELIDRNLAPELLEELRLSEMQGHASDFKGSDLADYAIYGSVSNAGLMSRFTEAEKWTDDDGKTHKTAATMKYIGSVRGVLKVASLRNGNFKLLRSIPVSGKESKTEETRSSTARKSMDSLVRSAAIEAIRSKAIELVNEFTVKGYVIEKRVKDGKAPIFQVELGSRDKVTAGDKVYIYSMVENYNALRNTSTVEECKIGEGKITNRINSSTSWIIVKDENVAKRIQIGDYVRVHKEVSFWDSAAQALDNFVDS